jgi:ankyrin repeat protein
MRDLKAALATNVDVNARDADGHTALILAIQHDHAAAVRELLVHGASATAADSQGNTPQKAARLRGNSAILVALRNFATH